MDLVTPSVAFPSAARTLVLDADAADTDRSPPTCGWPFTMDLNVRAARANASSTRQASECKTHRCVAVRDPGHSLGWCVTQLATADDVLSNNSARRNKTSGPRTARGLGLGFSLPVALTSAAAVAKRSNAESFLDAASAASTTTSIACTAHSAHRDTYVLVTGSVS